MEGKDGFEAHCRKEITSEKEKIRKGASLIFS